jgi:hypothetical protein
MKRPLMRFDKRWKGGVHRSEPVVYCRAAVLPRYRHINLPNWLVFKENDREWSAVFLGAA